MEATKLEKRKHNIIVLRLLCVQQQSKHGGGGERERKSRANNRIERIKIMNILCCFLSRELLLEAFFLKEKAPHCEGNLR